VPYFKQFAWKYRDVKKSDFESSTSQIRGQHFSVLPSIALATYEFSCSHLADLCVTRSSAYRGFHDLCVRVDRRAYSSRRTSRSCPHSDKHLQHY
jgi:hypothetical protein